MGWLSKALPFVGSALGGLLGRGKKGGFETQQVPRWSPEQQKVFSQIYGLTSPQIGKGLTPTPEETQYGDFLRNVEPWYRGLVNETYNPEAIKELYSKSIVPEFEQTMLPKIRGEFAGPGYWGEARARAVSEAYGGLGRDEARALYEAETRKNDLLMQLSQIVPVSKQTLANWSRAFTPENSPYLQLAMQLLNQQPFDTVTAYRQPSAGFLDAFSGAAGGAFGKMMPGAISALGSALGIGGGK